MLNQSEGDDAMVGGLRDRHPHGSTGQLLQEEIKQLILDSRLQPGDPMLTEAQLAERLGAGRNVVREALKSLQALGIIEYRRGFGMFVGEVGMTGFIDGLSFRGLLDLQTGVDAFRDLVEIRHALEIGLAGSVVAHMTPEVEAELGELVDTMERSALAGRRFRTQDRRFHSLLYQPLGNRLIQDLLDVFWEVGDRLEEQTGPRTSDACWTADAHRRVLDALQRNDVNEVRAAIDNHFVGIKDRLKELGVPTTDRGSDR